MVAPHGMHLKLNVQLENPVDFGVNSMKYL